MANRTTLLRGPALITHRGLTHYAGDGQPISLTLDTADTPVGVDGFGQLDARPTDETVKVLLTPDSRLTPGKNANGPLYPLGLTVGASLCTGTDLPLVIQPFSSSQYKYTVSAACVSKMPTITLAAGKPMFGQVEWSGCVGTAGAWGSVLTAASNAGVSSHSLAMGDIIERDWTFSWDPDGAPVLDHVTTLEGWTIEPQMQVRAVKVENRGTIDWILTGVSVTAKARILLTQAEVTALLGTSGVLGSARGASRTAYPARWYCSNGVDLIDFPEAIISVGGGLEFGSTVDHLVREITVTSQRAFSTGVPLPLMAFSTVS